MRRLVARRRCGAHHRDDREEQQRERRLPADEAREPPHRRAPDRGAVAAELGQVTPAVDGGEGEDRQEERELHEEQAAVRGPDEARDGGDLRRGVERARQDQREHADEGPPREASRREDRVGARVGARLASRGAEEEEERREAAHPHAGREQVDAIHAERARGAGLDGRRVAGGADEDECRGAEQGGLAARGAPVDPALDVPAHGEERGEQQEEALANEPDVAALRLAEDARERRGLEGGRGAALEGRRLRGEHRETRGEGQDGDGAREREDARLPADCRGAVAAPGEEERRRRADEEDDARQVDEADGEPERVHAASVTGRASGVGAG